MPQHSDRGGARNKGGRSGGAGPAAATGPSKPLGGADASDVSGVEVPKLPPFWLEWYRVLAEKWPLPVFVMALAAGAAVLLLKPREEPERSAEEYLQMARTAYALAITAQDERENPLSAVELLAGNNVRELAECLGVSDPFGVHGVLPSYGRARSLMGGAALNADDVAVLGEADYRLATIKREYPDGVGRRIQRSAGELYERALENLGEARRAAEDEDSPEWQVRRRLIADSEAHLGQYQAALAELDGLIETMLADQAGRMRLEKERGSVGADPGRRLESEWMKVYELAARCNFESGNLAKAAEFYRLYLDHGAGGIAAHKARIRLARLLLAESEAARDEAGRRARLMEVARLCGQVEKSDAPAAIRDEATFLAGRSCYRLGAMEADPKLSRGQYLEAARAFRHPFSPGGPYLDMSRVLLARSLANAGNGSEARELLVGILRGGVPPVIGACAEVCLADSLVEVDPLKALNGNGAGHGYIGAGRLIRQLPSEDIKSLVPELTDLLADSHFVAPRPDEHPLAAGQAQLLRIARGLAARHEYDECDRIYRHIIDTYPEINRHRYRFLLGELQAGKADRMASHKRPRREILPVRLAAAREFMRVSEEAADSRESLTAEALWRAGRQYFEAGCLGGARLAFRQFVDRAGTDSRVAEALYHEGESLRLLGDLDGAVRVFERGAVEHGRSQFGYLAELALGETYLEMGRLEDRPAVSRGALLTVRSDKAGAARTGAEPVAAGSATEGLAEAPAGAVRPVARPVILFQPEDKSVGVGERATFSVDAAGDPEASYQWRRRPGGSPASAEADIPGATASSYTTPPAAEADNGACYSVIVSNSRPGRSARSVFESIRRDARFTPESQVWMKSLFHLGRTYYLLGRARLAQAGGDVPASGAAAASGSESSAEGRALLELARETLEEAVARYQVEKYRKARPSFETFLAGQRLPVMHMLAMIQLEQGRYEQAVARFDDILAATAEVGGRLDRAEAEGHRRDAFMYKGVAQMRGGRPEAAAEPFRQGHEEFGRTPEGPYPWFAMACGLALQRCGRETEARDWLTRAASSYEELAKAEAKAKEEAKAKAPSVAGGKSEKSYEGAGWILSPDDWRQHCKWLENG